MTGTTTNWIEAIPSGWKAKRLKDLFSFGSGLSISKDNLEEKGVPVISYGQIHAKFNTGVSIDDRLLRYVSPSYLDTGSSSLVKVGDFIFADTSEDVEGCGNCIYIDRDMPLFAGYHTVVLKAPKGGNNKYLAYLFQSEDWRAQIRSQVCGVKLFSITKSILNGVKVIVPPINEQEKIVSYLDEKIAAINATIAARNEELKLLKKFKQSKIAEVVTHGLTPNVPTKSSPLGEIPAHWEVRRTKDVCTSIFTGATPSTTVEEFWDGDIPWIPSGCCHDCFITEAPKYITQAGLENSSTRWIPAGTTVMAITGATCAQLGTLKIDACANQSVVAFMEEKIKLNARYLFYILFALRDSILTNRTGGAQAGIDTGDCMNILICLPPLEEQIEIVSYLNDECEKIDKKCTLIEQQMEKLQLLKRALINEVVTGKRQLA